MNKVIRTGVYGAAIEDGKILLITQQYGPYKGKYDFPGGGIEFGESIEEALRREFMEEVGFGFTSMKLLTNVTTVVQLIDHPDYGDGELHQIGLIYTVSDLFPLKQVIEDLLPSTWIDIKNLHKDNASDLLLNTFK